MSPFLSLGGLDFHFVCHILPTRNTDLSLLLDWPEKRFLREAQLHSYGLGPFCRFRIGSGNKASGVYCLAVEGDVVYIGEALNLEKRFNYGYGLISPRNCYRGGQQTNCRINKLILREAMDGRTISLWFNAAPDRKPVEAKLIAKVQPAWNRTVA